MQPTLPGTISIEIVFAGSQQLTNCVLPTAKEEPRYSIALKQTLAACLDPFDKHNITTVNLESVSLSGSGGRRSLSGEGRGPGEATLSYVVRISSWGPYDYGYFSKMLTESVETGFFTLELRSYAGVYNASGLAAASSTEVGISLVSLSEGEAPVSHTVWTQALIFGIAFGVGGGLCVLCTVCYLSSKGPRPWEEGYEEWFWKNEETLRQSGIGVTINYLQQQQQQQHQQQQQARRRTEHVDEIPEHDEAFADESEQRDGGSSTTSSNIARRATVQLVPVAPRVQTDTDLSPWARDSDARESEVLGGGGARRL